MSGPHFKIHRHSAGFNAVPCSTTGWLVTLGLTGGLIVISILLVGLLVMSLMGFVLFCILFIAALGLYCWALIGYALKYGEDVHHG